MIDKLKELIEEAEAFTAQSKDEVEAFRIKYLGSKGLLKKYFAEFKNVANEQNFQSAALFSFEFNEKYFCFISNK